MKKVVPVLLALFVIAGTAHAADPARAGSGMSLDGTLNYATEPDNAFDDGWGFDLGFNVDMKRLGVDVGTGAGTELQGRVSLGFYEWEEGPLSYERIPLFVGGRFVWAASPAVKLYGQLGLELSFDEIEVPGFGSDDDTNLGLTPGVGALFPITDQFYLGAALNVHIISDSYVTLGVTAGYSFP